MIRRALCRLREVWYQRGHAPLALGSLRWVACETPDPGAVRWVPAVLRRERSYVALVAPPSTRIVYRLTVPARAVFRTMVTLSGAETVTGGAGLSFAVVVTDCDGEGLTTAGSVAVPSEPAPGWCPMSLDLRRFAGREVEIRMEIAAPAVSSGQGVQGAWGEPAILCRRTMPELGALARGYLALFGIRAGVARMFDLLRRPPLAQLPDYRTEAWRHQPSAATLRRQRAAAAAFVRRPVVSVLLAIENWDGAAFARTVRSVVEQSYPFWELCVACRPATRAALEADAAQMTGRGQRLRIAAVGDGEDVSALCNSALAVAGGDLVAPVRAGDALAPEALYVVVDAFNGPGDPDVVYSDEDRLTDDGSVADPFFKPAWSPEYFLSAGYTGHLVVLRRTVVDAAGGFRAAAGAAQEFDVLLRVSERTQRIAHVDRVLYHARGPGERAASGYAVAARQCVEDHLRRQGVAGSCEDVGPPGLRRVRYGIVGEPLVSIVLPTADRRRWVGDRWVELLPNCVASIVERTTYGRFEIVCIDDQNLRPETREALVRLEDPRIRLLSFTKPINLAEKMNFGARQARGEHLLFLNDDTEVLTPEWLSALLEFSQQERIGAVGAKLYFPGGTLQHGGMAVADRVPLILWRWYPGTHRGYHDNLVVAGNYSSLLGACLMTRATVFAELGGFDEAMPFLWHDIDYCFRVRAGGRRVVLTPHAELLHFETASRPAAYTAHETIRMARVWGDALDRDPFYNRHFRQDRHDFRDAP